MAKFMMHGIIVEEPTKKTVGKNNTEVTTLKLEERYVGFNGAEVSNVYGIDFIGKTGNSIPTDRRLTGKVAVVYGTMSSREYNGKFFVDLKGDQFTLAYEAGERRGYTVPPQPDNPNMQVRSGNTDQIEVADDDLPF